MGLERKISDFLKEKGVELCGMAGPERLSGPPSLNPAYTLKGAKSVVSFALPMDKSAILDFLGKVSPVPHNLDQVRQNQAVNRISEALSAYIRSLGHGARAVPANGNYRRHPDAFATLPTFSHRFGAIAAGIAASGLSGNVKTEEYGCAVYLGSVVTDAALASSPRRFGPRRFIDSECARCRLCARSCAARMMTEDDREEYVLINGELHPRALRRNIDLCNAACFGLHSLSPDKKWTTWGHRWIPEWVGKVPDASNPLALRRTLMLAGMKAGDSTARFDLIRLTGSKTLSAETISRYLDRHPENLPEKERREELSSFARAIGSARPGDFLSEQVLTCGHCAMICGPTAGETARRYKALTQGGLVVPGPDGGMVRVKTYEEAAALMERHAPRVPLARRAADAAASTIIWHRNYFGIEPRSVAEGLLYEARLRRAVKKRYPGHREAGAPRTARLARPAPSGGKP